MRWSFPSFLALCLGLTVTVAAQNCETYMDCDSCLNNGIESDCAWCLDDGTCRSDKEKSTCSLLDTSTSRILSILDGDGEVKPARTEVELRDGVPLTISYKVTVPKNKPINFYYLFDSSVSMVDDLNNVMRIASDLEGTLKSLCDAKSDPTCVKMQTGSFIDKPFNRVNQGLRVYPFWPGLGYEDGKFHPFLKDGQGGVNFTAAVEDTINNRVLANSDNPEASFEALMQAIACTDWTFDNTRRNLLLLATDDIAQLEGEYLTPRSTYPTNGDLRLNYNGRYALLLARAEEKCYYDPALYPTMTSEQRANLIGNGSMTFDGPSAGQLKKALLARNIIPIVAAAGGPDVQEFWQSLVTALGFGKLGQLTADSSNIQQLIQDAYASLASTVQLIPVDTGSGRASLVKSIDAPLTNAEPGKTYTVNVVLEANKNTPDDLKAGNDTVNPPLVLQAVGLNRVEVKIFQRTCDCYKSAQQLEHGNYTCGITTCDDGYTGARCQCALDSVAATCPLNKNGIQCSARGQCECGVCNCIDSTGPACECPLNDDACPRSSDGLVCGNHGKCACGKCECDKGWVGNACECPNGEQCPSVNGTVCNGRGACTKSGNSVCGWSCECESGFFGPACECDRTCDSTCNAEQGLGTCVTQGGQCGQCQCEPGFTPESGCRCKESDKCPSTNGMTCNGQGICECDTCVCQGGWSGPSCACSPFPCESECNTPNGECVCGECKCIDGFTGPSCACPVTAACPMDPSISNEPCGGSLRGICVMENGKCGQCECFEGYGGAACNCTQSECPVNDKGECSGNGVCDDCGSCKCHDGYAGTDCSCSIVGNPCPDDCNNRGTCIYNENECGVCECSSDLTSIAFTGTACECSATECPVIDGAVCGEHGTGCDGCSGQCLCQDGWMQPTLTDGCICANTTGSCVDAMGVVCGGHGTCNSPQCGCNCEKGWKGPTCSECDPSVTISTVLNAGQYCNGVLVTTDGYTCQQSTCMSFCTAASSCSDCESLVNSGCGWCGATQTCSDAYTATLVCKDDPSRVNESCNGGNSVIVPAAAGAAAGAAVLLIAGLLGFKAWRVHLDKKEWAAYNVAKNEKAWISRPNPLFESRTIERLNPLYSTDASAGGS